MQCIFFPDAQKNAAFSHTVCTITDIDGKPLAYDGTSSVIAVSAGASKENYLPLS